MKAYSCAPVALVLFGLLAAPADAQPVRPERPERPYRGLFGGGTGNWDQSLVASASLGGGWDSNLIADARGGSGRPRSSDLDTSFRGGVAQANAGLQYGLSRSRVSLGASAGTTARYYPSLTNQILRREYARVGASGRLGGGVSVYGSAAYMPYSLASLFAVEFDPEPGGEPGIPDVDILSSYEHFVSYGGGVGFRRQVARRTTVSADYGYRARESSRQRRQFESHGAGGRVTYDAARGLTLRAGYRFNEARYGTGELTRRRHLIDAGANYNRSLSVSRRTTVSFGTGTAATTRPESDIDRTRFTFTGSAGLNHEMGRTWNASVAYSRGVRFDEAWPEPVFNQSLTASLGGLVGTRLQFRSSARASSGRIGFESSGGFNSYYANAGLGYALTRYAALGVAYSYYRHRFEQTAALLPGLPSHAERHSVRAYLNLWAPLFQRSRRANAAW